MQSRYWKRCLQMKTGEREAASVLTPREIERVRLMAHGLHNKEIADQLFISEGTVKVHLHRIYEKLGLYGRMSLMRYAHET